MLSASSFRGIPGFLLLVLLTRCAPPVIDCGLHMVARMPLEVQDELLVVPAGINGEWVRLVVDTGAERTMIADATAERLALPHDPRHTTRWVSVGGTTITNDVTIGRLVLGGVHFPLTRIALGTFTLRSEHGLNADGLLGADVLLAYDMDIDVPGGKLTLYSARRCPQDRLPWQEPAAEITGIRASKDRLLMPFELDGMAGMAILDTGSQRNVVGADMARRLGLDSRTMAGDPVVRQHGVGPAEVVAHVHQFSLLRVGPMAQRSPALAVMESDAGMGDAVVGQEFLLGQRVWLSFRNRQIYVSFTPSRPPRTRQPRP